jgi:hypothetical protein
MFNISFNSDIAPDSDHGQFGTILFGAESDNFNSYFTSFSRKSYEDQWRNSVRILLKDRKPTGLFCNVDLEEDGTGLLWLYTVIPAEDAKCEKNRETGYYITQRFLPVCTDPNTFLTRKYWEFEDGTQGKEISYYFLDLAAPERFFDYLDPETCGISSWFVSETDMRDFAEMGEP